MRVLSSLMNISDLASFDIFLMISGQVCSSLTRQARILFSTTLYKRSLLLFFMAVVVDSIELQCFRQEEVLSYVLIETNSSFLTRRGEPQNFIRKLALVCFENENASKQLLRIYRTIKINYHLSSLHLLVKISTDDIFFPQIMLSSSSFFTRLLMHST